MAKKREYYPAAIEISSSALKLLQLAKSVQSPGYEIAQCAYLPLNLASEQNLWSEGQLASSERIRNSLQKLIQEHRIGAEVVSCLPINKIQSLTYILPNMPKGEIEQAIAWKLKQNPPGGVTLEDLSFDYLTFSHPKNDFNNQLRVLVFVVSKEAVMKQVILFKEFSLKLIAFEPKPYSALGALSWLGKIPQEETVLVIQLGAVQSSIIILYAGEPYLIRQLAVSGNSFTEAIVNYHQLDWQRAEALKKSESPACGPALSSQLENLVLDIEHTFKYFAHQLMKSEVISFERIILCGGSAKLHNLAAFLAERLGAVVDVFDPLSSLHPGQGCELAPLAQENSASFSSSLGLAIRSIEW